MSTIWIMLKPVYGNRSSISHSSTDAQDRIFIHSKPITVWQHWILQPKKKRITFAELYLKRWTQWIKSNKVGVYEYFDLLTWYRFCKLFMRWMIFLTVFFCLTLIIWYYLDLIQCFRKQKTIRLADVNSWWVD